MKIPTLSTLKKNLILEYIFVLQQWNEKMNLVSRNIQFHVNETYFDFLNQLISAQAPYEKNHSLYSFDKSKHKSEPLYNLDSELLHLENLELESLHNLDSELLNVQSLESEPLHNLDNKPRNEPSLEKISIHTQSSSKNTLGPEDPKTIMYHIANSIQLAKFIPINNIVADIGSGNGLPGILLGILGFETILIETNTKKCKFLDHLIQVLLNKDPSLSLRIINKQVQECKNVKFDTLVSRAFSSNVNLLEAVKSLSYQELITLKSSSILLNDLKAETIAQTKIKYDIRVTPGFGSNVVIYKKIN